MEHLGFFLYGTRFLSFLKNMRFRFFLTCRDGRYYIWCIRISLSRDGLWVFWHQIIWEQMPTVSCNVLDPDNVSEFHHTCPKRHPLPGKLAVVVHEVEHFPFQIWFRQVLFPFIQILDNLSNVQSDSIVQLLSDCQSCSWFQFPQTCLAGFKLPLVVAKIVGSIVGSRLHITFKTWGGTNP